MHDMDEENPTYTLLTPNQVVAHNLRRARLLRGWSQEEAAEHLEPHLGVRWSRASYSSAERSTERPERIRNFSADDIVAFALAFKLPVTWFFLPPEPDEEGRIGLIATPGSPEGLGHVPGLLIELVFGNPESRALTEQRLGGLLKLLPTEVQGRYMQLIGQVSGLAVMSAMREAVGDLVGQAASLREVADLLERANQTSAERMEAALEQMVDNYYTDEPADKGDEGHS